MAVQSVERFTERGGAEVGQLRAVRSTGALLDVDDEFFVLDFRPDGQPATIARRCGFGEAPARLVDGP